MIKLCKCGCGKKIVCEKNEYVQGHNPNSHNFIKGHKIGTYSSISKEKRIKTIIERNGFRKNGKINIGGKEGQHNSINTEFKKGHKPWITGKTKEEYPQLTNKSRLGQHPSKKEIKKRVRTYKKLIKLRGYKTIENSRARLSEKINLWRLQIFQRDNYTCQICGKTGCYLEAHHIKNWAKYPLLRFKIYNGITVCKECHKKTNNYKGRGR